MLCSPQASFFDAMVHLALQLFHLNLHLLLRLLELGHLQPVAFY